MIDIPLTLVEMTDTFCFFIRNVNLSLASRPFAKVGHLKSTKCIYYIVCKTTFPILVIC